MPEGGGMVIICTGGGRPVTGVVSFEMDLKWFTQFCSLIHFTVNNKRFFNLATTDRKLICHNYFCIYAILQNINRKYSKEAWFFSTPPTPANTPCLNSCLIISDIPTNCLLLNWYPSQRVVMGGKVSHKQCVPFALA